LCTGLALGHSGAFVLQPPYLLFYADRNHDDQPDADPEVLLTGFGMEDAHACANSLTWGPDGWLYGAQGSTVTAKIRGLEFQQGIWRYHPISKQFELFAEGGGNTWGLDFDEQGEILAGTNFDDKMLHQVQGGYYVKNFGKHGALHNPHTYGYFDHVPYSGYRGAHISIGGIVYQGGMFPAQFTGNYIFANTLDHAVYWATLKPSGSSFTAAFAGTLLKTEDVLFRPVDCELGPDGAIYIADWCDKRASHLDPLDTWDRSNGRIYRIQARTTPERKDKPFNLQELASDKLVDLLSSPNAWFARKARLLLAERRDASVLPRLRNQALDKNNPRLALQSLWALYVTGGFDETVAADLLKSSNDAVRSWTIRLLGDSGTVLPVTGEKLVALARSEPSPVVRAQLACSAKRLPGNASLPILRELLRHAEDVRDPHLPLLIWWALENKCISHRDAILHLFASPDLWQQPIVHATILERLSRRYTDEGDPASLAACARLLELAPNRTSAANLMHGMEQALAGRRLRNPSPPLDAWFAKQWPDRKHDVEFVRFGLLLGNQEANAAAAKLILDDGCPEAARESLVTVLGSAPDNEPVAALTELFQNAKSARLRRAALSALQQFPEIRIAQTIVDSWPKLDRETRDSARNALCSRAAWAVILLQAVDAGKIDSKEMTLEQLRQLVTLKSPQLSAQVEKRWGKIQAASPEEKRNTINRIKLVLKPSGVVGRDAKGDLAEGKKTFQTTCATCHKLFGEGNNIGPDLSGADRKNTDYLLEQIINPTGYIRPEYASYEVETKDGQVLTGLIIESAGTSLTLVDRNNQQHVLPRSEIQELKPSQVSLMPEGLLEGLSPQQVMDLFAYVQQTEPAPASASK
jgi:putative membrane-bound dehydrogenase-like protein